MNTIKILKIGIAAAFFLAAITCTEDPVGPGPVNITGTVTDIDGNVYTTVKIGTQEWMAENLRTTRYNDSTEIPFVTKSSEWYRLPTPAYCYYNNTTNASSIKKFGALYNWHVVNPLNPYKIAPKGWHVPDTTEWNTMQNYLITNGYNYDGTTDSNKIAKSMAATTDWKMSTQAGAIGNDLAKNNKSGFMALPGGGRYYDGTFLSIGSDGGWWCTTEGSATGAWLHYLNYNCCNTDGYSGNKSHGFSVRLLRDSK
jgi:uncharacterized protein (TIGR02145 family)